MIAMRPNPLVEAFIRFFGDLKLFWRPPVIVYDPGSYRVKGRDTREAMEKVQPGDVLVRGYVHYLDGYIIPGFFSHVGMYLGKVQESDRASCTELVRSRERWSGKTRRKPRTPDEQFATGDEMVIHALAEGVLVEDFLDFCRCDYMAILRLPEVLQAAGFARPVEGLSPAEAQIQARLLSGQPVPRADAVAVMREVALSKVGYPYDAGFDFTDFTRFSCTELVYYATRCLSSIIDVAPRKRRVLLMQRTCIEPDDFVRALEPIWWSPSVDSAIRDELRPPPGAAREEIARVA